jgi:hypothetical protein
MWPRRNEQYTTLDAVIRGKVVHFENRDLTVLLQQKLSGENITEYMQNLPALS